MDPHSFKLPEDLAAALDAYARQHGSSRSAVVREAIAAHLARASAAPGGSCLELAGDVAGIVDGPRDLATSPRHLKTCGR